MVFKDSLSSDNGTTYMIHFHWSDDIIRNGWGYLPKYSIPQGLTHFVLVTPCYIGDLRQHWIRLRLAPHDTKPLPELMLTQVYRHARAILQKMHRIWWQKFSFIFFMIFMHTLNILSEFSSRRTGGHLNKKDNLTRYGDSHVKDKTS